MSETELSAAELRVLDSIDEGALVDELIELVRVPSITGTDAEADLQHRAAGQLEELGFTVDAWKLDLAELAARPDYPGTEAPRSEGTASPAGSGPAAPRRSCCSRTSTSCRPATSRSGWAATRGAGRSLTASCTAGAPAT